MLKQLGLGLLLAASLQGLAQSEAEFLPHRLHADSLRADLTVLTSREMAGRGTGQSGYQQAANYVSARLQQWGLQHFENLNLVEDGNPYGLAVPYHASQLRGASLKVGKRKFKFAKDFIATGGLTNGITDFDELVVIGHGKLTEKGAITYDAAAVKGKWVLAAPGNQNAKGEVEESFWREQYRQLANAGASGVIVMHPAYKKETPALLERLLEERISLQKTDAEKASSVGNVPVMVLSPRAYNRLLRQLKVSKKSMISRANDFSTGKELRKKAYRLQVDLVERDFEAPNVAGFIRGTDESNEWVLLTAHLDHLGEHHGKVFQGADDNGSGSAALISVARQLAEWRDAGMQPRRNIALVWFSGEENGLLGSRYFSQNMPMASDLVVTNINVDMVGRYDDKHDTTSKYLYLIGADRISQELHDIGEAVNARCCNLDLDYTYNDPKDPNRYYFRSDHYNFAKLGIPSVFYFSGVHADYHKETDTIEKINFARMATITEYLLYTSWELANRSSRPKPNK